MKLLDASGKPIEKTKVARAVFFESDDGESWNMMKPVDVPKELSGNRDVMGCLMAGEIIEAPSRKYYRVERLN